MSSIHLPYQKPPRWNINRATIALNCARLGLPVPKLAIPMWEGAGNRVYDYSGNNYLVTLSSGVIWDTRNLLMDGDDSLAVSPSIAFTGSDEWTIVAELYDTDTTDNYNFWIGKNDAPEGFTLREQGNNLKFRDTGNQYTPFGIDESLTPYKNKWTHHIYVADGSGNLKAYLDGKLFDSITPANGTQFTIDYIGRGYHNDDYNFHGWIKYVYIFPSILNPTQVKILFNNNPFDILEIIKSPQWIVPLGATTVAPTTLAPTSLVPTTLAPTSLAPTTAAPTSLAPTTAPATTSAPTTPTYTTIGPTTVPVATTPPPTTVAPTTLAPTTIAPTTLAPTTLAPTSLAPTTLAPTTEAPTTPVYTTVGPTTVHVATTPVPTTAAPTTLAPTTLAPTTVAPTTIAPTTLAPTTLQPTTLAPSTSAPTTAEPTTLVPTTLAPTTLVPTTIGPTTIPPTTLAPSTSVPTTTLTTAPPTTAAPETICVKTFNSIIAKELSFRSPITKEIRVNGYLC